MFNIIRVCSVALLLVANTLFAAPLSYYFPNQDQYRPNIPTPEQVLGFEVGERHIRHDQLIDYFEQLDQASELVEVRQMGYSQEHRKQIIATISSQQNLARLDEILSNRQSSTKQADNDPAVVWLGYSIHGNEISGANASLLVAYQLAAAINNNIDKLLDNLVIVIEPSMNPDGMDRFTTWVNTNRNQSVNTDHNHREHHLQWPSGRTNHYMFDLNRDWLPLTQQESRNRLRVYHHYKPNVLGDFHEMGRHASYFFQPGVPSRNNPLTPSENFDLTKLIAGYHAKALDAENRLYYSEESFDDFFYGKGSTYPDINGTIGILFEQASSRGYITDSANGILTFAFGIKNHVLTSFSTLTAASDNKTKLHNYRHQFYQQIEDLADEDDFAGFLFTEPHDRSRLNAFLELLSQHQVSVYPLQKDYQDDDNTYQAQHSFFVPLEQAQYRLVKTLFNKVTTFNDNTFYDVSGWTMPLAYNISFTKVETNRGLSISSTPWQKTANDVMRPASDAYAYAFHWDDYLAPKLLNKLLNAGIRAKVNTKKFSALVANERMSFDRGSIIIPAALQTNKNWFATLTQWQQQIGIDLYAIETGFNQGIDIGSPSLRPLNPIKVLLIGGHGISQYEAGHMLYYLDSQLNIPVSVVDTYRLSHIDFNDYSHIIMVDGNYEQLPQNSEKRFADFAQQGGTLIAQKGAVKYLANHKILNAEFVTASDIDRAFNTNGLSYEDKQTLHAEKLIAGTIFETEIDLSHPLAYGYNKPDLAIFKNSTDIITLPATPFVTVNRYQSDPLMSGYAAPQLVDLVAGNASIIAHDVGRGRVIASDANLVFRGYWPGTAKIIANSLFFSKVFSAIP
ncbi:M14 family zinc carboxypeptidase [Thalassotalea maritima]|uniref:M14 family zinc carboxypeptidase n=1 Tax=Thalassotalea maritima TaxID=3242416 RepID=UPI0035298036